MTTKAVYNINRQEVLVNIISAFHGPFAIRRKIDVSKLSGITVSELSSEFVIHVRSEYDYRFGSPTKRNRILSTICHAYYLNVRAQPLAFFFRVIQSLFAKTYRFPLGWCQLDWLHYDRRWQKERYYQNAERRSCSSFFRPIFNLTFSLADGWRSLARTTLRLTNFHFF